MARVLILSGATEFADPWHDLESTCRELRSVLVEGGHDVQVRADLGTALGEAIDAELIVVNCSFGGSDHEHPAPVPDNLYGLTTHLRAGRGVLAVHSSVMAFPGLPRWAELLGARWEPGVSTHPPRGPTLIRLTSNGQDPIGTLSDFRTDDERYTDLVLGADIRPVAEHLEAARRHPLIWTRTDGSGTRVASSGLGHDRTGYQNPTYRELLRRMADWAAVAPRSR